VATAARPAPALTQSRTFPATADQARKLTALAKQTGETGGDPALLDALPMLGDVLPKLPNKIKTQLFDAVDLAMLYSKAKNQVTCFATITASTPAALAAIIADSETPTSRSCPPTTLRFQIWRAIVERHSFHDHECRCQSPTAA
jgi:hypothetical protein